MRSSVDQRDTCVAKLPTQPVHRCEPLSDEEARSHVERGQDLLEGRRSGQLDESVPGSQAHAGERVGTLVVLDAERRGRSASSLTATSRYVSWRPTKIRRPPDLGASTTPVHTITEDATIDEAVRKMRVERCRRTRRLEPRIRGRHHQPRRRPGPARRAAASRRCPSRVRSAARLRGRDPARLLILDTLATWPMSRVAQKRG